MTVPTDEWSPSAPRGKGSAGKSQEHRHTAGGAWWRHMQVEWAYARQRDIAEVAPDRLERG